MKEPDLRCKEDKRRHQVRSEKLNGLDYLEVRIDQKLQLNSTAAASYEVELYIYFLGKAPEHIRKDNIRIEGGVRIREIKIQEIELIRKKELDQEDYMIVHPDKMGDFSTYTLRLIGLEGIDPRYDHLDFSFKAGCPSDLDCKRAEICPTSRLSEPQINYLAKDYASFRQLILDRMALIIPQWKEKYVPDLGVSLVELLAYTGDYLSYYQDAVATEAYLETARKRISVRRHVRLLDYFLHEGCNSRAWVCVETDCKNPLPLAKGDYFFLAPSGNALPVAGSSLFQDDLERIQPDKYLVFEPIIDEDIILYQAHNEIQFYTWEDQECCLVKGATSATLKDYEPISCINVEKQAWTEEERQIQQPPEGKWIEPESKRILHLKVGDVLIFEEIRGPKTGNSADADPMHRHAVRLVKVEQDKDPLNKLPILKIEWASQDALPFPICISSLDSNCVIRGDISVARGNVILVDHGKTVEPEPLDLPLCEEEPGRCKGIGEPFDPICEIGLLHPLPLKFYPVTHAVPFPEASTKAKVQARILAGLMDRVLERVHALLKKIRGKECLSEQEIEEVVRIFGSKAAEEVDLTLEKPVSAKNDRCQKQASALERLMALESVYLFRKRRRLDILVKKARSGYVMGAMGAKEIEEMFGQGFAYDLKNSDHFIPASLSLQQDPRLALPSIYVTQKNTEAKWTVRRDLLDSKPLDRHFVAEIDDDESAHLRFGDGKMGRKPWPEQDAPFEASYRIGNGLAGNVGAEAISYLVSSIKGQGGIKKVRNPMPARGGVDPEALAEVKLFAPATFRRDLQRAIVAEDYALLVERFADRVQNAAAQMRWNGSWNEVQVAVDPRGSTDADPLLLYEVESGLHLYRRIGHNLGVKPARYVPLDIEMDVCVLAHYDVGHVKAALLEIFSNRVLPDGSLGFFHPDKLTFGEGVRLSKLVAAASRVPGVESVRVTKLERLFEGSDHEIENGILSIGPLEVARMDNDPSFPENGRLALHMGGGL